jgi:hypothetical protein
MYRQPWGLVLVVSLLALVLGFVGGIAAHAVFPAEKGSPGLQGPPGKSVSAASLNLGAIGLCVSSDTDTATGDLYYETISDPTDNDGSLSCSSGTFVNLDPLNPNGQSVTRYYPMLSPAPTTTTTVPTG